LVLRGVSATLTPLRADRFTARRTGGRHHARILITARKNFTLAAVRSDKALQLSPSLVTPFIKSYRSPEQNAHFRANWTNRATLNPTGCIASVCLA